MPAMQGQWLVRPDTDEPGLWLQLSSGEIVGVAQADWPEVPAEGDDATRLSGWQDAATTLLQAAVGDEVQVSVWAQTVDPLAGVMILASNPGEDPPGSPFEAIYG